jgi:DNA-binding response OmpR family regulator
MNDKPVIPILMTLMSFCRFGKIELIHSKSIQTNTKTRLTLKILLIEDEIKIAEFVIKGLSAAGYDVTYVEDGARGLEEILAETHELAILDVMLPKLNGFEVLRQVRESGNTSPVIILSAKVDLPDRLMGFDVGADDYLPKPFFVEELVARIKAVMHRKAPEQVEQIAVSHLTLDVVTHKVQWFDVTAMLSQREFSLLAFLMRSPGHIYSRQQILKHVWEINFDPETNVVDVCVRRIKRKLERGSSGHPSPIESVRGVGYRLRVEE